MKNIPASRFKFRHAEKLKASMEVDLKKWPIPVSKRDLTVQKAAPLHTQLSPLLQIVPWIL